jgi:hypothetical protein
MALSLTHYAEPFKTLNSVLLQHRSINDCVLTMAQSSGNV